MLSELGNSSLAIEHKAQSESPIEVRLRGEPVQSLSFPILRHLRGYTGSPTGLPSQEVSDPVQSLVSPGAQVSDARHEEIPQS